MQSGGQIAETILAVLAFLFAVTGGWLALRGVKRDSAAYEEAARRMIGAPGEPGDLGALMWTVAEPGQRAVGAVDVITGTLRAGQDDLRHGAWLGLAGATCATLSAILAIWL